MLVHFHLACSIKFACMFLGCMGGTGHFYGGDQVIEGEYLLQVWRHIQVLIHIHYNRDQPFKISFNILFTVLWAK